MKCELKKSFIYLEVKVMTEEAAEQRITKLSYIVTPAQFGKTGIAMQIIENEIKRDLTDGKSIHFVFTQNTHLNQNQFLSRLTQSVDPNKLVSLGSKITNIKHHYKKTCEILYKIFLGDIPDVIVVCSNHVRYRDIYGLICNLQNLKQEYRCFVYFDEVHKIFDSIKSFLTELDQLKNIVGILGMTATPEKIRGFGNLLDLSTCETIKLPKSEYYYNLEKDHQHVEPNLRYTSATCYAISVLEKYPTEFFTPDKRTFIPSEFSTECHMTVKHKIMEKYINSVVCVINGCVKRIYFQEDGNEKSIDIDLETSRECAEFSEKLAFVLNSYRLVARPIFITGYICLSLGITLCHKSLGPFTASIVSHLHLYKEGKYDDLYQLAARTAGNMKHWATFSRQQKTKIFCPRVVYETIVEKEKESIADYETMSNRKFEKVYPIGLQLSPPFRAFDASAIFKSSSFTDFNSNVSHNITHNSQAITTRRCLFTNVSDYRKKKFDPKTQLGHEKVRSPNCVPQTFLTKRTKLQYVIFSNELQANEFVAKKFGLHRDRQFSKSKINPRCSTQPSSEKSECSPEKKKKRHALADSHADHANAVAETNQEFDFLTDDLKKCPDFSNISKMQWFCESQEISSEDNKSMYLGSSDEERNQDIHNISLYESPSKMTNQDTSCWSSSPSKRMRVSRISSNEADLENLPILKILEKKWGITKSNKYRKIFSKVDNQIVIYWK